jgi:hypothetical protein
MLAPAESPQALRRFTPEEFRSEYDRCWPWLDAAIARFGRTHEKEDLWRELNRGPGLYFFSLDTCATVCRINIYPTGLKEVHVWLVGGNLRHIRDVLYPKIEAFGKGMGCHRMIAYGRKGWLRVLAGWFSHGETRVKSLMGPQPTAVELKYLGYTEREDDGP